MNLPVILMGNAAKQKGNEFGPELRTRIRRAEFEIRLAVIEKVLRHGGNNGRRACECEYRSGC